MAHKILAKTLAALWLLDGLLQFQPKMFSSDFINNVLAPNLAGQPAFLHALIALGIHVFNLNIPVVNFLAATLQVIIGVLLFFPTDSKTFKTGLYLSIIWGLIVWIFGEGLGNLLAGSASFYTGMPGAALLYALIAAFLLVPEKITTSLISKITAVLLLLGAALQFQPMFWNSGGPQMVFQASAADTVHTINAIPTILSNSSLTHAVVFNWLLIIIPILLAAALFFKPNRITAALTIVFLLAVWWLGQDFGSLSTVWMGTATDVNTAPLLMLLILPLLMINQQNLSNIKNQP